MCSPPIWLAIVRSAAWSGCPTPDEEDSKRIHREREHLVQDRTRLENRILALLATQGIRSRPSLRNWDEILRRLRPATVASFRLACLQR